MITVFRGTLISFGIESPGIGRLVILLLCQAIIFWGLILLIELNVIRTIIELLIDLKDHILRAFGRNRPKAHETEIFDPDVMLEKERIEKTALQTDTLIVRNLTKYYGDFLAVDHIYFGVKRGECFGLLGVNGAGKTTTFKMITGDENMTSGDVYVNGIHVKQSIRRVRNKLGYCPQFEGLLDQLTGKETLVLFCRLRGIKGKSH